MSSLLCRLSKAVTSLCSITLATDPADPLRARVLSGIFPPRHQTFPSLFFNPTIGASVLTVVGYPHAGLPTREKRDWGLALEYSRQLCRRNPLQVLPAGCRGMVARTRSLFLPSAQHRPLPVPRVFLTPLLGLPYAADLRLSSHVQFRTHSPEVRYMRRRQVQTMGIFF